jgi:3-oxoacyl-[acyl-carrier-protein] synthase III
MNNQTLKFNNASIAGIVTVAGDKKVDFLDSYTDYNLSEAEAKRLSKVMGLSSRYIVSGEETTSDLCFEAAKKVMVGTGVSNKEIGGLIFVSQTPDFSCPATAMSLQDRLGISTSSVCFDLRLGCSGFVYGLATAYGFIEAGLDNILLCVGDVASKLVDPSDHTVAPIMGDAGSVILIQRRPSESVFHLYSDGSGYSALIVPNSGARRDEKFLGHDPVMNMDGAQVFDFTLKRVPSMIEKIMEEVSVTSSDIDHFVLHQPNKYILQNIKKRMKLTDEKVPHLTQSVYGNQNSASIPGTINGFLSNGYSSRCLTTVVAGFGIGLSWGAGIIKTENIYAPKTFHLGE